MAEFIVEGPDLPVVIGQQQALIPYIVTAEDQPQGDPDGADWHEAHTLDWQADPARQRVHRRGVRAWQIGNLSIWIACDCAQRIVGHYARGATSAFATDIARSVDTVENMAHAADLYQRLLRAFHGTDAEPGIFRHLIPKLRQIRRKLSYTHFSEMWTLWRSDPKLTPLAVFADLQTAADDGISSRSLKSAGAGDQGSTAIVATVYGIRSDYLADLINHPEGSPADTYLVVLQGSEWVGVGSVKVRPA